MTLLVLKHVKHKITDINSRHLGYYRTGNSAIRSTDPENLILEPNITSIGKVVAKLWPFLYIQDGRQPPSWILSNRK